MKPGGFRRSFFNEAGPAGTLTKAEGRGILSVAGGPPTIDGEGGNMITAFEESLDGSHAVICMQKENGEIFYQNPACRKSCGDYVGAECPRTCVSESEKFLGRPLPSEGFQFLSNRKVGKQHYDVLFFTEDSHRMTVLYPLRQKYEAWLKKFQERNLSRRELEIANLCVQGYTNAGIARELFISKATLKTHLNNLYKKMPEARSEGWRKSAVAGS